MSEWYDEAFLLELNLILITFLTFINYFGHVPYL